MHLKKCGGTTINRWLATSGLKTLNDTDAEGKLLTTLGDQGLLQRWLDLAFDDADIVATHLPVRAHVPAGTFCFTVLRQPRQRILSQVSDWRREASNHTEATLPAMFHLYVFGARDLGLREYLSAQRTSGLSFLFDNHMTRFLAAEFFPAEAWQKGPAAALLPRAIEALEERYHLVGTTDDIPAVQQALAEVLVAPPPGQPGAAASENVSRSERLGAEVDSGAAAILDELSECDDVLFDHARRINRRRRLRRMFSWPRRLGAALGR